MRYAWDAAHTHLGTQAHRTPIGSAFGLVELVAGNIISKLRLWDRLGADRVDVFIANSKNVAGRIRKYYRKDSIVIYPPVDVEKIAATNTHQDYFLIISRLVGYKRVELAVQACENLGLPLVIIGTGPELENLKKMTSGNTKLLGWVSDEEKFKALSGARALIFPGEEDLGIVPVEAMAAGKPVIAYRKGGLLETVIENKTGIFFDEQTVTGIENALHHFIAQEKDFDWHTIRQHAEQFGNAVFESKIRKVVDDVLDQN
jgi:glycosyltransferase involved in cell wall biosynthesis